MEICGIEEAIETLKNALKCNKKQFEELGTHILLQDDEQEAIETLLTAYEKEKEDNKRLRKCHLQYEEMTGIDLLLPEKEG